MRVGLIPLGGKPLAFTQGLRWDLHGEALGWGAGGVFSACNQLVPERNEVVVRLSEPALWTQTLGGEEEDDEVLLGESLD